MKVLLKSNNSILHQFVYRATNHDIIKWYIMIKHETVGFLVLYQKKIVHIKIMLNVSGFVSPILQLRIFSDDGFYPI